MLALSDIAPKKRGRKPLFKQTKIISVRLDLEVIKLLPVDSKERAFFLKEAIRIALNGR